MEFNTYAPSVALANYVKWYWSLEHFGADLPLVKERIFPDGCIELVFHYGGLFKKYNTAGTFDYQQRGFIHGQLKEFIEIEPTGAIGVFSIRFHPAGLQRFVPFDISELTAQTIAVADIWPDGNDLLDRMLDAKNNMQRVQLAEAFLLAKLNNKHKEDKAMQYCVESIATHHGIVNIDALAAKANLSRRQFERRFTANVGIGPKLFARITRFRNVLQMAEQQPVGTMAALAYDTGFYDQAHFIKDFKAFTGLSPKDYFTNNLETGLTFNA